VLAQADGRPPGLAPGDRIGQAGDGAEAAHLHRPALQQAERPDFGARLQEGLHDAAAARVEAGAVHPQPQAQPEPLQVGPPGDVEEVEAGAGGDVGAAGQRQLAGAAGTEHQRQVDGV
jgi:hypothetical protein